MGGRGGSSGLLNKTYGSPKEAMEALYNYSKEKEDGIFKRWQKGDQDRLYINIEKLYNMEVGYRNKSGRVRDVKIDGVEININVANKMLTETAYIDVKTGRIYAREEETVRKLRKYIPKRYTNYKKEK